MACIHQYAGQYFDIMKLSKPTLHTLGAAILLLLISVVLHATPATSAVAENSSYSTPAL
jgi:hypothetical protein